jgi:hypothetical protein
MVLEVTNVTIFIKNYSRQQGPLTVDTTRFRVILKFTLANDPAPGGSGDKNNQHQGHAGYNP